LRRPIACLLSLALVVSAAAAAAFGAKPLAWDQLGQADLVTLVNLHPDPKRNKLSSVDYLQQGLIPVCTPVETVSLNDKELVFRVKGTGAQYEYEFHKTLQGSKQAHLDKIFGPGKSCPKARIAKMSKTDQEGIKQGVVTPGMTKAAVVIAVGYPPEHATASLDLDQWRYWTNRFNTRLVLFSNGKVSQVQE